MTVTRSVLLFLVAALAEIGGAWMVWQAVRENRGWMWAGAGVVALGLYGFVGAALCLAGVAVIMYSPRAT